MGVLSLKPVWCHKYKMLQVIAGPVKKDDKAEGIINKIRGDVLDLVVRCSRCKGRHLRLTEVKEKLIIANIASSNIPVYNRKVLISANKERGE